MTKALRLTAFTLIAVVIAILGLAAWAASRQHSTLMAHYRTFLVPSYAGQYRAAGPYPGPTPAVFLASNEKLASNGLPIVKYGGTKEFGAKYHAATDYATNPVTIIQYGLWAYNQYIAADNDRQYRMIVIRAADWLVRNQHHGAWFYNFDYGANGWQLKSPWISALAQGQAMSLLERTYRITHDRVYLTSAVAALKPIDTAVANGGARRCFFGNCSRPFYEEYPSTPASYTLNGFMFTLIGLYDLASVAPHVSALADYTAGRATLAIALPRYNINMSATYDLTHETIRGEKPNLPIAYQAVDVYLLQTLDSVRRSPVIERYAALWARTFGA